MRAVSAAPPPPENSGDPEGGCDQNCTPILINLSEGPWRLSGTDDPVLFDIDANGRRNRITWTGRGEPLAFLALDRNGNGAIDNGAELFGTATPGGEASNGFEALAYFDANGDGVVDATDPVWSDLLLWVDADHDGVSQPSEIGSIAASHILALATDYREAARMDADGNAFRFMSLLRLARGQRAYYDVVFRPAQ